MTKSETHPVDLPYRTKKEMIGPKEDMELLCAYSVKDGGYIGNPKDADVYIKKYGITEFYRSAPDHPVCSIGWCPSKQKWYGWSHRAIYGFGIGDEVKEGDCCATSGWTEEYLQEHPEADTTSLPVGFKAKTLEDAKRMAIAFAESVS